MAPLEHLRFCFCPAASLRLEAVSDSIRGSQLAAVDPTLTVCASCVLQVATSVSELSLPAEVLAILSHGETYNVSVSATSHAGLSMHVSVSFAVDRSHIAIT